MTSTERSKQQEECGLPPGPLYDRRLQYDPRSNFIVLSCSLKQDRVHVPQIFVRNVTDKRYVSVADSIKMEGSIEITESTAIANALVDDGLLAFVVTSQEFTPAGPISVRMLALGLLDLCDLRVELWDIRDGVSVKWIIYELVGFDSKAMYIYAIAGFPLSTTSGYHVEYHLVRLQWRERSIEKLARFENIHF